MGLAAIGLILSLLVHLSALLGFASPLGEGAWLLHPGIFVVWIPAVLVLQRLSRDFTQRELWQAALRGCPPWMRWMTYGFFAYALLNFAAFLLLGPGRNGAGTTPSVVFRGFSGHWMAFYSAALAIFYSALHADEHDELRRCPAGHRVSPLARYCERCGQAVHETPR
jgi:hypothetical protein